MLRGAASAALLVRYGQELGLSARSCLAGTGISADALADPEAEISARQELGVVENIVTTLGDRPGLGLAPGLRYGLHTYGIFGFAVLSSSTLGEAITIAERFLELSYALVDIHAEISGGELAIVLDGRDTPPVARRFAIERDAAAIALMQRELVDEPVPFRRVSFSATAPGDLAPYVQAFGVAPQFAASANTLVLDAGLLDRPLPRASSFAAAQCQAQCQALIDRRHQRVGVSGQVRAALLGDPRAMADQQEVADTLAVSVRTLRRRLALEGTNFRTIVNETKGLLAQELLETGQLTVDQVADRLGYSEASSFVHAFTRWSGEPPGRWMRRSLAPRAG